MKNLLLVVCILMFLLISNCKNRNDMILQYSDGNGNTYIITNDQLEYKPVTPDLSSSGTYDGGEEKTVDLSSSDFDKIKKLIESAAADKSVWIENRVMMSGLIKITKDGKVEVFIIEPGCDKQVEIERLLNELIN